MIELRELVVVYYLGVVGYPSVKNKKIFSLSLHELPYSSEIVLLRRNKPFSNADL